MNSTQLIEFFNKRKKALGEKATDFNMFLEGYAIGIADLDVRNAIVREMIDKACECFELAEDWTAWSNEDWQYAKEYFRKAMEQI